MKFKKSTSPTKLMIIGALVLVGFFVIKAIYTNVVAPSGINEVGIVGAQGGFMFKWTFDDLRDYGPTAWQFIGQSTKPKNYLRITQSERFEVLGPITSSAALVNKSLALVPFRGTTNLKVEFDLRSNYRLFIPKSDEEKNQANPGLEESKTTVQPVLGVSDTTNALTDEELSLTKPSGVDTEAKEEITAAYADLLTLPTPPPTQFTYPMKVTIIDQNGILGSRLVEGTVNVKAGTPQLQHYSITLNVSKLKLTNPMLTITYAPLTKNITNVQIDNIQISSPLIGQPSVIKEGPTTVTGVLGKTDLKSGMLGEYNLQGTDGITYDLLYLAIDPKQALKPGLYQDLVKKLIGQKVTVDGTVRQNIRRNDKLGPVALPQLVVDTLKLAK